MTSPQRGCCLLISNNSFSGKSMSFSSLQMTNETAAVLRDTFQRLGFHVVARENVSASQLMEEAQRVSQMDHGSSDCLAVALLAPPGTGDTLLCSDGEDVSLEAVRDLFKASRCPSLAGKPKVFYRPFSRGFTVQDGVTVTDEDEDKEDGGSGSQRVSDDADFLVIETCPPGCMTTRNSTSMVVDHVQLLSSVLERDGHVEDLVTCLTKVNYQLSKVKAGQGTATCVTAPVHSTLRKQLKFPKIQ